MKKDQDQATMGNEITSANGANAYTPSEKVLIATLEADYSASLGEPNCFADGYTRYEISFECVQPETNNAQLIANYYVNGQLASDPSYNSENYSNDSGGNGPETNQNNDFFYLWAQQRNGPSNTSGVFGTMTLFNPNSTDNYHKCYTALLYAPQANSNLGCQVFGTGAYLGNTNQVTGIQFSFTGGSYITAGIIRIYGYTC